MKSNGSNWSLKGDVNNHSSGQEFDLRVLKSVPENHDSPSNGLKISNLSALISNDSSRLQAHLYSLNTSSDGQVIRMLDCCIDSSGLDADSKPKYCSHQVQTCHPDAIMDDRLHNEFVATKAIGISRIHEAPPYIDLNISKLPNSISKGPPDPPQKQQWDPDNPKHMITGGIRLYDSLDPMNNGRVHTYADDPGNVNRSWEADTGQIVEKHDKKLHTDTKDDTGGGPR